MQIDIDQPIHFLEVQPPEQWAQNFDPGCL